MTNKQNVKRYDNMGCPEEICRVDTMYESDDGDYVLYADYEALQVENDRLRAKLAAMESQEPVPEAIKLLQRVAEKTTERDPFEAERLASKFCEQRGLEDGSVSYRQSIDAFTTAYRMRNTSAAPSPSQQSAVKIQCLHCGAPVQYAVGASIDRCPSHESEQGGDV